MSKKSIYPKVSSSKLMAWCNGELKEDIEFLQKYGSFCSEYVVCPKEDKEHIESLLYHTDKKIIPIIGMQSSMGHAVQAKTFMPSDSYCCWLEYLFQNENKFSYILMANECLECISGVCILNEIEKRFLNLKGKMVFAQYDFSTEEEARRLDSGNLDIGYIKEFMMSRNIFMNIHLTGYWVLYNSLIAMKVDNYASQQHDHQILGDGRADSLFPYSYYSKYLKSGINIWSGIGMVQGARRHNLSRLVDFGYKGCMFFAPSSKNIPDINSYFTDVEGWEIIG